MSSHPSAAKQSSDIPWMIGSALIFGPALAWCLSQSGNSNHAHHDAHSESKEQLSVKDSEGTETPVAEVIESVDTAVAADSLKGPEASEEQLKKSEPEPNLPVTDADGETVSEEVKESVEQAVESDSPKDAQQAEQTQVEQVQKAEESQNDGTSKKETEAEESKPESK